ncbi:MAG: hypothetical protein JRH10_20010 [Deltaproteobacteria bacterium]|nr:hypothetical protein [Deltaproteobacteria bacterium]MBW2444920.1 hypothetical protein [Deltaproteobacteria bacterium]
MFPRLLPAASARTLFNVADALRPPAPGEVGFDWVAGVEAVLARRGPPSAKRLRAGLRRLEWGARLRAGRPFHQLPRSERALLLKRTAQQRPSEHGFWQALLEEARPTVPSDRHYSPGE